MTEPRRYGFRSLRFKLVLASVVIEVIMLTALVWNSARITGNALTEISQNHLESLIPLLNAGLATPLAQRDYATLDEQLGLIVRRESLVYVEVRDELGKLAAVRGKVPETAEYNTSLSEPADGIFNQTFDITVANRVIGRARYGLNVTLRETTIASLRRQGAVVAFAEIVITFLLLSALGFFLTRHLKSLAQASRALQQGDYSVRVTAVGRDEVADTATAFNAMAATVELDIAEREHAADELRRNEERYQLVAQASNDVIWDWDIHLSTLWWNQNFSKLFGYPPEEIKPGLDSWTERVHPDDVGRVLTGLYSVLDHGGASWSDDYRFRHHDGSYAYIFDQGYVLRDDRGKAIRMVGAMVDVSARRQASEQTRILSSALEQTADSVIVTDRNGVIEYVNPAFETVTGYSAAEALGRNPNIVKSGEHDLAFYRQLWNTILKGEPYRAVIVNRRKDGVLYHEGKSIMPLRDANGAITHFVSTGKDITERIRAEESRHRQALIFENLTDAVMVLDNSRRIMEWNPACEKLFGYTKAEAIGNTTLLIQPQDEFESHDHVVSKSIERHGHWAGERNLRRKDGSTVICEAVRVALWDRNRRTVGRIVINRDITERKQAELEIAEGAARLEQMSRQLLSAQEDERRRLARELHDELGQSLTAIKINLESRGRFKGQSLAEIDATNIHLIEDTLQQVRRLALALRPSMLDDLGLSSALRWMAGQEAKRGGFVVHFGADFPEARLSPELEITCFRIAQAALTNIVRHAQASRVTIELRHEGDALVMTVQDDGSGFDVAEMHTRAMAGDSIGILSMQERAMLIGGQLTIESAPRQGTKVSAHFPWRAREESA